MKKLVFALVAIGLFLMTVSILADSLGFGGESGMGAIQFLGLLSGAALTVIGVGLLTVDWGERADFRQTFRPGKFTDKPTIFWVLVTFLIAYLAFFLFPVFFSGNQIHYLTKYIPDAYVTRIGFDIEAIVSRIQHWMNTGQSPYADGFIAYPPFAIAVFSVFPILGYPAYFKLMMGMTLLAYLAIALILPWSFIPKQNRTLLVLFFISGLFSYGFQFEQERGQFNLIAFALTLFAIYIFHFHPEFRFFAYVLFSVSIQLKIYPVFFIFMFVDDWKNWRVILKRFLGLGLVNFLLLFILGYRLFLDFVRSITDYQLLESSRVENLSIKGFAYYLSNDIFKGTSISTRGIETMFWLLLAACFLAAVWHAISYKTHGLNPHLLLISTIAALVIPSVSNDYKLSFLTVPVALVLCCNLEANHLGQKKISTTLMVILVSLAYWTTLYPATVKPEYLIRNFPALIVILILATVLNFLAPYSYEGTIQNITKTSETEQ